MFFETGLGELRPDRPGENVNIKIERSVAALLLHFLCKIAKWGMEGNDLPAQRIFYVVEQTIDRAC